MRIALAQINPTLGDFAANAAKILEFAHRAHEKHADVVVFPELALFGYPPNDVLERLELVDAQTSELGKMLKKLPPKITLVFGAVIENKKARVKGGKSFINAAVVARRGTAPQFAAKRLLPAYDIFDEARFVEPGDKATVVRIPGLGKVGISVCEDMWADWRRDGHKLYSWNPLADFKGVDLVINISASPFSLPHRADRIQQAQNHAKKLHAPFVYVNQVGAQDELIFDGRSFVLDGKGKMIVEASAFEEDLVMLDLNKKLSETRPQEKNEVELLRQGLVLGIRDFVRKTGQKSVHLGLSGGIDSAVVATLAVDALGPNHVTGLLLPGPFSSEGSLTDALALAKNLHIAHQIVDINEMYLRTKMDVEEKFCGENNSTRSIVDQNLQARLRGLVLMGFANARQSMLLTTGNKSELATGYCTLYGDMCGGLAPIGDLLKNQVYKLAQLYNSEREVIPEEILMKAPSAELAPNQVDQDTLPPYDQLDAAVKLLVEERKAPKTKLEKWTAEKLMRTEFKRWQAPPVLRVSEHAFGRGRRMPIAISYLKK